MRKIRFGAVGTGKITGQVIKGGREDERFEVSAVYSRTKERAEEFAATFGIEKTYTSLEAMASDENIDAIYIASPNYAHAEQAIMCMEHKKHVLCEKPIASNAEEAARMFDAARENGVLLMEAMISTLNPNFLRFREMLPKIGTLRRYFASFCQYSSRYDRFKDGIILNTFRNELSNGSTMDVGIYTIYPMVVLFGRPDSICAQGINLHTGVDGQGSVNFKYKDMEANILYSKISDAYLPSSVDGEDGSLVLDQIHIPGSLTLKNRRTGLDIQCGESLEHDPYFYEIQEFINLLEKGCTQSEINSHENSLITMEIMDEIRRQLGIIYPADKN